MILLLKARITSYTRTDGTFVSEHDDSRQAAAAKAIGLKPDGGGRYHAHTSSEEAYGKLRNMPSQGFERTGVRRDKGREHYDFHHPEHGHATMTIASKRVVPGAERHDGTGGRMPSENAASVYLTYHGHRAPASAGQRDRLGQ